MSVSGGDGLSPPANKTGGDRQGTVDGVGREQEECAAIGKNGQWNGGKKKTAGSKRRAQEEGLRFYCRAHDHRSQQYPADREKLARRAQARQTGEDDGTG